jgi:16S rRNA (guanine527-N7)-methyltransferase
LLGPEGFAERFPVSRETLSRLEAYADLLIRWSARINLVGRDTLADLWRRHIIDSAQLVWSPTLHRTAISVAPAS